MKNYLFKVEVLESGQRGKYQDSFYSYKIVSDLPEHIVKSFCMNVLRKSYPAKDMPNPFAGKLLEFKKVTDNNKDRSRDEDIMPETYSYKTQELYTG